MENIIDNSVIATRENKNVTFDDLIDLCKTYLHKSKNIDIIKKAYEFAKKAHEGQFRKSGDPYIQHPLEVAYLLAQIHSSPSTISAGLLHDVLEDTAVSSEEFIKEFGLDIYNIVDGVTKISQLKYMTKEKALARSHQKILLAMAKDMRVVLVKILDRVHNMRTLEFQPPEKQVRIAQETLDLYAPLAHRIGMYRIKAELEDTSFKYINKEKYQEIYNDINLQKKNRESDIENMRERIDEILQKNNIKDYKIKGRIKNIYSIYNKMTTKNLLLDQIYDLMALRIIVNSISDCYQVLGLIHSEWKPLPGRFKDYISTPKSNLYQSLHTTVLGIDGKIFEVQIRTYEMDNVAENGIAAHWAYKEENLGYSPEKEQQEFVTKLKWYKDLLDYAESNDDDDEDPMYNLKNDIFSANVYVFTPRGDVFDFPNGSTPLDFAYRVHTEVGNHCVAAIVNKRIVPLSYALRTGDVIEIKTNKSFDGPSESWLKIVKTTHARHKISSILNKKKRDEMIELGKNEFDHYIKSENITIKIDDKIIKQNFSKLSIMNLDDFFYFIGKGDLSIHGAINRLIGNDKNDDSLIKYYETKDLKITHHRVNNVGIYVDGLPKAQVKLASCCMPVRGDGIVGYVSKGNGIICHRYECHNVKNSQEERFINVYWDDEANDIYYDTMIAITSFDGKNIVAEMINTLNSVNNVTIMSINSKKNRNSDLITKVKLRVNHVDALNQAIANLNKINNIYNIERLIK